MMLWREPYASDCGVWVHRIGTEQSDPPGFVIDRPTGCGEYDFVHFTTPVTALVEGRRSTLTPGSCLLFGPATTQWYTGDNQPYTHDWFHFSGPAAEEMVRRNHLPIGRVFRPRETRFVTDAVLLMYLEVAHAEVDWQRAVAHQLELLFIRLRRSLGSHAESLGRAKMVTRERMRNVRMEMRGMPERRWCVDEMAGLASLSRSRFSALYREFFGVSPREDLTAARLERARRLLSASVMTVDQVARHVGYDDPAYFNRLFKRKVGITPGSYR